MKDLFVKHQLAKLLKEKGFNEPCMGWYYSDNSDMGKLHLEYSEPNTKYHLNAPFYNQVTQWLSKEHNIKLIESCNCIEKGKATWIWGIHSNVTGLLIHPIYFESLDKTVLTALDYVK